MKLVKEQLRVVRRALKHYINSDIIVKKRDIEIAIDLIRSMENNLGVK